MITEHMELDRLERIRYFVPTAICAYLAAICLVLVAASAFVVTLKNPIAITAVGMLGMLLTGGLGLLFWRAQRQDLAYQRLVTGADAPANFAAVRAQAEREGWRILREEAPRRLIASSSVSLLDAGERISVKFRGSEVLVASICEPSVGFSLVGRRHCLAHRQAVRLALSDPALGGLQGP